MTRFQRELSGELGQYWITNAINEAKEAKKYFEENAYVEDGVVRWTSNNSVPHDDMLEKMEYIGCKFDRAKSNAVRIEEDAKFIEEYRKNQKPLSQQEIAEMRAEFGVGTVVVDVLSGRVIKI